MAIVALALMSSCISSANAFEIPSNNNNRPLSSPSKSSTTPPPKTVGVFQEKDLNDNNNLVSQQFDSKLSYKSDGMTDGTTTMAASSSSSSSTTNLASSSSSPPPSFKTLRAWTQEYFDAMENGGGMTSIFSYSRYLDDEEYVHTGSNNFGPINKEDYVTLMKYNKLHGLDLSNIISEFKIICDGWHRDLHDPYRIWVVVRYSGIHTGIAKLQSLNGLQLRPKQPTTTDNDNLLQCDNEYFDYYYDVYNDDDEDDDDGSSKKKKKSTTSSNKIQRESIKLNKFVTGPEIHSYQWTPNKTIRWQTSGFVGDVYVGSNEGYGGLLGILISLGLPRASVDIIKPFATIPRWISQFIVVGNNNNNIKGGGGGGGSNIGSGLLVSSPPTATRWSRLPLWWHEQRKNKSNNIHR